MTTQLSRSGQATAGSEQTQSEEPRHVRRRAAGASLRGAAGRRLRPRVTILLAVALGCNALVAAGVKVPVLRPVAGLLGLALVPSLVSVCVLRRHRLTLPERVLYAAGFVLLGVLGGGLVLNYLGPLEGVQRPLSATPLAVVSGVADVVLVAWRGDSLAALQWGRAARWFVRPLGRGHLSSVLAASALVLAVTGALRLDNAASGSVAYAGLALVVLALLSLFLKGRTAGTDALVVYLSGAALLLGTSLRSWYVVGHDDMREFYFFRLTDQAAHWDIGAFPDPYNACLSVTILPTVVVGFTGLSGAVAFKVLLQLAFALVPVATYLFARRLVPRSLALVGTMFVLAFPTFWVDMPYLVRQEIAFCFLTLLLLAATQPQWGHRRRLAVAIAMATGVVLSHYSTTYILTLTVALGVVALHLARLVRRRKAARHGHHRPRDDRARPVILCLPMLCSLALMAFVWTGPVTHTGSHFREVVGHTVDAFVHPGRAIESSDLRYALFAVPTLTPQQRLDTYAAEALHERRATGGAGRFVPLPAGWRPQVAPPELTRPTPVGSWLTRHTGLPLHELTGLVRDGAARALQAFVLLGLVLLLVGRKSMARFSPDIRWLGVGAAGALAVEVLAPGLSVEYGILRAFQQALLVLAPAAALGCAFLFGFLGRFAKGAAVCAALVVFAVLTDVAAGAVGGYAPQLHLANTGVYYDLYYRTPQDTAGMRWLEARLQERSHTVSWPVISDASSVAAIAAQRRSYDGLDDQFFPSLLLRRATVFASPTTVREARASVLFGGDVIAYHYPLSLLEAEKSRVYDNGSVRVYR